MLFLVEDTTSLGNKFWSRATDGSIETSLSQVSLLVQVANLTGTRQILAPNVCLKNPAS